MKGLFYATCFLLLPFVSSAQKITYSEPLKEDNRNINFEIVGKSKNTLMVFKHLSANYAVALYNLDDMSLKEQKYIEFFPAKTFNVDYLAYPDFVYFVYQYQDAGVAHCMVAKVGYDGRLIGEQKELDTTYTGTSGENKIYSAIQSDDKKQVLIFKMEKKAKLYDFTTLLYNDQFDLLNKSKQSLHYNDWHNIYGDFVLDNDGNFIFTLSEQHNAGDNINSLYLVTKKAAADSFSIKQINLNGRFIDEVKINVDNTNKKYLLNSFYYTKKRDNINGIFGFVWDAAADSAYATSFTEFDDSVRSALPKQVSQKAVFDNFFIRYILLKKDGSYYLTAEDYSSSISNNNRNWGWNRWNYIYSTLGYPWGYGYNPLYYKPRYFGMYRPYNSYNPDISYFYNHILLLNMNSKGEVKHVEIINKEQHSDDEDNHLSFSTFVTGAEIHFLYNLIQKREKLITDEIVEADGHVRRNPSINTFNNDHIFMPKLGRQIGAKQVIIPCLFHNHICFAKIDF